MPMYNVIEHSDNYSKTFVRISCKNIPTVNNDGDIVKFNGANANDSFNFKAKITGQAGDNGRKEVEIMVPLKYLGSFWGALEIHLTDCQINLILTCCANCVVVYTNIANQGATFAIIGTKLNVPVVTLSTQYNAKLSQQLKPGLKRITNWNNYISNQNY